MEVEIKIEIKVDLSITADNYCHILLLFLNVTNEPCYCKTYTANHEKQSYYTGCPQSPLHGQNWTIGLM
jgi:hypothetical protein